jgi:hypothetical protein
MEVEQWAVRGLLCGLQVLFSFFFFLYRGIYWGLLGMYFIREIGGYSIFPLSN